MACDGQGRPPTFTIIAGNVNDCTQFEQVMARISASRCGPGRPRCRPGQVCRADPNETPTPDEPGLFVETFWAALHGLVTLTRAGRLPSDRVPDRLTLLVDRFVPHGAAPRKSVEGTGPSAPL